MLSAIIRGRTMSCCSPAIQASAAPGTCNAVSDWVGSCVITIKRRLDRAQGSILNSGTPPRRSGDREAAEDLCDPLSQLTRPVSLPTRYDLQVRPPFQFFDHAGSARLNLLLTISEHHRTSPPGHACGPSPHSSRRRLFDLSVWWSKRHVARQRPPRCIRFSHSP
jgi:hypothetical protein